MVDMSHEDPARPSSNQIARSLLESAKQDPALLGRLNRRMDNGQMVTGLSGHAFALPMETAFRQPIRLLGAAPYDSGQPRDEQELETLVSIAVESAHQAEDAVQEVRRATGTIRRGLALCAGLGVVGIVAAMAAIIDNHLSGVASAAMAPPEIASIAPALAEPAPAAATSPAVAPARPAAPKPDRAQATGALPALQTIQAGNGAAAPGEPSRVVEDQKVSAGPLTPAVPTGSAALETPPSPQSAPASGLLIATAATQPVAHPIVPPVYHGAPATYRAPWPNRRPVHYYAPAAAPRVVVPPFFIALRRDVSALFRGFPPHS